MKIISRGFVFGEKARAFQNFYQGHYRQADEAFQVLLKKHPQDIMCYKALAFCSVMDESFREAIEYLDESITLASKDPELPNLLALLYLRQGKMDMAIDTLLNALDIMPSDALLKKTLKSIQKLNGPDHAKTVSIMPLVQLTLARPVSSKIMMIILGVVISGILGGGILKILADQNANRFSSAPLINNVTIRNIDSIIDARESFSIAFTKEEITKKYEELRSAISENKLNKARILVNELLASNASFQVKERVSILEGFIGEPTDDNIDFVPRYSEIAAAPLLYKNVVLRWNGTIVNVNNDSKQTTFNLLINFVEGNQVEGIGAIEFDNPPRDQRFRNGEKVIVTGVFDGITPDNRIIVKAIRISSL